MSGMQRILNRELSGDNRDRAGSFQAKLARQALPALGPSLRRSETLLFALSGPRHHLHLLVSEESLSPILRWSSPPKRKRLTEPLPLRQEDTGDEQQGSVLPLLRRLNEQRNIQRIACHRQARD
jgi:hypothetical protein